MGDETRLTTGESQRAVEVGGAGGAPPDTRHLRCGALAAGVSERRLRGESRHHQARAARTRLALRPAEETLSRNDDRFAAQLAGRRELAGTRFQRRATQ